MLEDVHPKAMSELHKVEIFEANKCAFEVDLSMK